MPESPIRQLIIFRVGPENFVMDIRRLVQIISYRAPTPLPRSPDFIEGIIVLRNQVVPVVSLSSRLFPSLEEAEKPKILILRIRDHVIGFKVDSVHRIINVEQKDILPPPPRLKGLDVAYIRGVVQQGDEVYIYLNTDRILRPEEMDLLDGMNANGAENESV